jgi:pericentriolar material 1 protein
MSEIVPVLKEHIGDVCSQQLLQYIKRLVLLLTKQQDEQQENAKFFQSQLGSIVHDSLAKFEGRK